MRVFVSFGFSKKEAWVENLVIPMLDHMGITVLNGREIPGGEIDGAIRDRIEQADALIGFLLRRGTRVGRNGVWPASDYVRDELSIALGRDKHVVQVVETGVSPHMGMLQHRQRLPYDVDHQAEFLVRLAHHVREWTAGEVKVRLLPDHLAIQLARQMHGGSAHCRYHIVHESRLVRDGQAEIQAEGGSLFVKLLGFSPGTYACVRLTVNGVEWASSHVAHSTPFSQIELNPPPPLGPPPLIPTPTF